MLSAVFWRVHSSDLPVINVENPAKRCAAAAPHQSSLRLLPFCRVPLWRIPLRWQCAEVIVAGGPLLEGALPVAGPMQLPREGRQAWHCRRLLQHHHLGCSVPCRRFALQQAGGYQGMQARPARFSILEKVVLFSNPVDGAFCLSNKERGVLQGAVINQPQRVLRHQSLQVGGVYRRSGP